METSEGTGEPPHPRRSFPSRRAGRRSEMAEGFARIFITEMAKGAMTEEMLKRAVGAIASTSVMFADALLAALEGPEGDA